VVLLVLDLKEMMDRLKADGLTLANLMISGFPNAIYGRPGRDADIEKVMAATVDAAERSVASTPTLLDVLREAGVVDSGGQGIYRLFEGALLHLAGRAPTAASREGEPAGPGKASTVVAHVDDGFGYETMFLLHPNGSGALDLDAIRDRLEVVLKPMPGLLANARGYAGTTLLGDGVVLLVLDLKEILP